MNNKIQLIFGMLSIIIALCAWLLPLQKGLINTITNENILNKKIASTNLGKRDFSSKLFVSGLNIEIFIKKGSREYQGGEVRGMNEKSTIYISRNQGLDIKANGSNIKFMIEKDILENVNIVKSGLNIDVIEL